MRKGDYFTFSYTMWGSCLECKPNKPGFCLVLQYGTKIFRLCPPCLMKIEHQVFEWKIEEDNKKIWKPHKEWPNNV